jgi:hypothetical protein
MASTKGEQPRELTRMRQRLDEFRRGTKPRVAFPGWAAARLARRHGVHRTGRALGLEYNKLKRASGGMVRAAAAGSARRRLPAAAGRVKFVELTGALPLSGACYTYVHQELKRKGVTLQRYEHAEWLKAKVYIDYHVEADEHYYSVLLSWWASTCTCG